MGPKRKKGWEPTFNISFKNRWHGLFVFVKNKSRKKWPPKAVVVFMVFGYSTKKFLNQLLAFDRHIEFVFLFPTSPLQDPGSQYCVHVISLQAIIAKYGFPIGKWEWEIA